MKKYVFFFVIIWASAASAQNSGYHPFPDSNARWNIYYWDYGWPQVTEIYYSIEISGDTSINGFPYHKLFTPYLQTSRNLIKNSTVSSGYKGAIRQDTLARTVYIVPPFEVSEQLLYDFNLQETR